MISNVNVQEASSYSLIHVQIKVRGVMKVRLLFPNQKNVKFSLELGEGKVRLLGRAREQ